MNLAHAPRPDAEQQLTDISRLAVTTTSLARLPAGAETAAEQPLAAQSSAVVGSTPIPRAKSEPAVAALAQTLPSAETPSAELIGDIQAELQRVGCLKGQVDRTWTDETRAAAGTFTRKIGTSLPTELPDHVMLTLLRGHSGTACVEMAASAAPDTPLARFASPLEPVRQKAQRAFHAHGDGPVDEASRAETPRRVAAAKPRDEEGTPRRRQRADEEASQPRRKPEQQVREARAVVVAVAQREPVRATRSASEGAQRQRPGRQDFSVRDYHAQQWMRGS